MDIIFEYSCIFLHYNWSVLSKKMPNFAPINSNHPMTIKKVVYLNTIFIILILTIAGVLVIWEMTREVAPPYLKDKPRHVVPAWPKEDMLANTEFSDFFDGIDISEHQGRIFWDSLSMAKHKPKFIFVRAFGKDSRRDQTYHYNIEMSRKYNIPVGTYIFFTMALSVQSQFNDFLEIVDMPLQDLRPVIDVESLSTTPYNIVHLKDSVLRLAQLIEEEIGAKPIIYSNQGYYKKHLAPTFNDYPLWIAHYSHEPDHPEIRPIMWQRSERGHVQGIWTYVDLDNFINGANLSSIMLPKKER